MVSPAPGPLLPVLTFRSYTEAVTLGKEACVDADEGVKNRSDLGQLSQFWLLNAKLQVYFNLICL